MSKLIYITNTSLDGYVEDETGDFDWVNPDEVFSFITDLLRPIVTYIYGRRLYDTMAYWDAPVEGYPPKHFARIWKKPEKIVFSRTLTCATTRNTRVERDSDHEAIRKLKRESETRHQHWRRRTRGLVPAAESRNPVEPYFRRRVCSKEG